MEIGLIIILGLITLLAIIIKSIFGFGVALMTSPLFVFFLPFKLVVGIVALLDVLTSLMIFLISAENINLKSGIRIIIGMFIGTLIGTNILTNFNASWLSKLLGLFLIGYVIYRFFLHKKDFVISLRDQKIIGPIVGLIGGVAGGISNINGPPIIMYLDSFLDKSVLRATLGTIFLFDGLWRITLYAFNDIITTTTLNYVVILLPFLLVGFAIGNYIHKRSKVENFDKYLLVFLLIFGIRLLYV